MKWPASVTLVRHGQSAYNALRIRKEQDPLYQEFKRAFEANFQSEETRRRAEAVKEKYALEMSDYETPLTNEGAKQALFTGQRLSGEIPPPDVVFYSPYWRTRATLGIMCEAWAKLGDVEAVPEDRIREQEHGLALLYSDWRLFHVFHPEQKLLRDLQGPYWYQYPGGESVSQVRDRTRDVLGMLIREWAEKHVLLVTHHLTILSFRANLERLTPEQFTHLDEFEKPVNCGVTRYEGDPNRGKDGRLVLRYYNLKLC